MGVLVDYQIRGLCESGMLDPFDPDLINPASIDVRIGDTAKVETEEGWWDLDISDRTKESPLWVTPKEFLLVAAEPTFNMPDNIAGEFRLKSSRAREGWNNCLAVWLDPGWTGSKLTLELINECRFTRLPLYPGLKIGQVIFYRCDRPMVSYRTCGRYNGDKAVAGSKG